MYIYIDEFSFQFLIKKDNVDGSYNHFMAAAVGETASNIVRYSFYLWNIKT